MLGWNLDERSDGRWNGSRNGTWDGSWMGVGMEAVIGSRMGAGEEAGNGFHHASVMHRLGSLASFITGDIPSIYISNLPDILSSLCL